MSDEQKLKLLKTIDKYQKLFFLILVEIFNKIHEIKKDIKYINIEIFPPLLIWTFLESEDKKFLR